MLQVPKTRERPVGNICSQNVSLKINPLEKHLIFKRRSFSLKQVNKITNQITKTTKLDQDPFGVRGRPVASKKVLDDSDQRSFKHLTTLVVVINCYKKITWSGFSIWF